MPTLWRKTGGSWSEIKSIYRKTGGIWQEILTVYRKTGGIWTKVFSGLKIPGNSIKPTISGTGYLYSTLTNNSVGTWTNSPTSYARQWMRANDSNGTPGTYSNITGATGTTYTTTSTDDGKWIAIKITATNASGSNSAASDPIYINKYTPVSIDVPTFDTSIAKPGTAITVIGTGTSYWKNTTTNTGDTIPDSYTYLWVYEDGTNPVNTNTGVSYTPAVGDVGKKLKVTVTAKNTGGTASRTSNLTSIVSNPPVVDVYPTITSSNGYKTKYASNLFTGSTTDGTAYDTPAFRGNTGSWTPDPTTVNWYFQYSADGSTSWTSFYDFEGVPVSSGSTPDTLENQNHDWYIDDFYTSAGALGTVTSSTGKYVRFASEGFNNSVTAGLNFSSAFGPIYAAPSAPGNPVITWSSAFDSNNSYITAYWTASTTKFTYYLQYYNGTSWVTLGSGTTTTPTSGAQFGPVLAPHGSKSYRVINMNADNVFAKSGNVTFDSTPPPGNVTDVRNFNFSTWNSQLFLTTGIRTSSVQYTFNSTNLAGLSIGPFTQSTSNSTAYLFTNNLSNYFTNRGTYSASTTYNVGDYVLYSGFYYFCRQNGTFGFTPGNNTYWTVSAGFLATVTPYNGTKAGSSTSSSTTLIVRPDSNTDPAPNITSGPTFSSVGQNTFTITYNPNTYTTNAIIDVKTGSPANSITGYPKTVSVTTNVDNTDSPSGLVANTDYSVSITPRYVYATGVFFEGSAKTGTQRTLATAPNAFTYTVSQGGSVTAPATPTITRVSSTSNTVLFEIGSTKPTDTLQYGINQSGAAFGTRIGTPAQTVTTLNGFDATGSPSASGTYDTISTIESGSSNSEMTISTTAVGTTRVANANVSVTTGASSWAINFSWAGASASSITYYSNGTGTSSASTDATVTVYTNSMPVKIVEATGANNPTITINNITAYSGSGQTGSTRAGTAGTTTSLAISRPTSTSSTATQYYTYYTAPTLYTVTFNGNGQTSGTAPSALTQSTSGGKITLPGANTLAKTGYTFYGWNTASAQDGTRYDAGSDYTPSANTTLYANWSRTLTYDKNTTDTVTGMPTTLTTYHNNNASVTVASAPSRTGYTFDGWATSSTGAVAYTAGGSITMNNNYTLYAKWTASGGGGGGTPGTPSPTAVRYTATGCNFTAVSWATTTNSVTYDVYRSTTTTAPTSTTTPTATGVADGVAPDTVVDGIVYYEYPSSLTAYYWVRGVASNGTKGAWSARVTPTLQTALC